MKEKQFKIVEIFSSIQGEGILLGERQIFIRLADCNLKCKYCDTDFENFKLMTKNEIVDCIEKLGIKSNKTVVFTGGEPLLHTDLILEIYNDLNLKIMLETNGTLPNDLEKVIDKVDIVSCDFKIFEDQEKENQEKFFEVLSLHNKNFYVKLVLDENFEIDEFEQKILFLSENVKKDVLIILQPIFNKKINYSKGFEEFHKILLRYFENVFFIPQIHKILGVR